MHMPAKRIAGAGLSLLTAWSLLAGLLPSPAFAGEVESETALEQVEVEEALSSTTLFEADVAADSDSAAAGSSAVEIASGEDDGAGVRSAAASLDDGAYAVAVSAKKATDVTEDSMLAQAVDASALVTVENGSYALELTLQGIPSPFPDIAQGTFYATDVKYYEGGCEVVGSLVQGQGALLGADVLELQEDGVNPRVVKIPLAEDALTTGYVMVNMAVDGIAVMGAQDAVVVVDWSSAVETEAPDRESGQETSEETVDKTALDQALATAESRQQGAKSDLAWQALQSAIASAKAVQSSSGAKQADVDAQVAALNAAVEAFDASADEVEASVEAFQVGHTYQVPITFLKTGSADTSMAAQYFGSTALVRPQEDGTFKVSFSTNRSDYIVNVRYDGVVLSSVAGEGTTAEYTLSIPASTEDVVVPLTMSIQPMIDLGGGDVTADMHLQLTQAVDLGTGQESLVSSTTGGAVSSSTTSSGSSVVSSLAKTGDGIQAVVPAAIATGATVVAALLLLVRRVRSACW